MRKPNKRKFNRLFITIVIFVAVSLVAGLSLLLIRYFKRSELFLVKKIETNIDGELADKSEQLLLPRNIVNKKNLFGLDIAKISADLKSRHPQYKDIIVQRQFPDTLYIKVIRRTPFVQVKVARTYLLVDKEYIIISVSKDIPYTDRVILHTILPKRLDISLGSKIIFPYGVEVISLMDEFQSQEFFENFNVGCIYAYSLNDIWFDLNGVEIRVGQGDYKKKLQLLKNLIFPRFRDDLDRVEYIDLRFEDYVVGYKR